MQILKLAGCGVLFMGVGAYLATIADRDVQASIANSESNLVTLAEGDDVLAASRDAARTSFDSFWTTVNGPEASAFDSVSIKVGIPHANGSEHLWMSACQSQDSQRFDCTVSNDPATVPLQLGARYSFDRAMISDWMYRKDGKIHGGYSIRVLLPTLPEDKAEALSALLAPISG